MLKFLITDEARFPDCLLFTNNCQELNPGRASLSIDYTIYSIVLTLYLQRISVLSLAVLLSVSVATGQRKVSPKKPTKNRVARVSAAHPTLTSTRLHFCGEIVPTEQGDVSGKLAMALAGSSGYARHVGSLKARSAPFFAVIEPILQNHNIPNDFKYLPLIESAWHAEAVSSAGAVGYWQFMDETAQDMGLNIESGKDERTDLRKSTEAAARYIKLLYRKLGSWTLVAAAYNGGVGMVQRKISRTGHRDYYSMAMNPETGYYLYRILAMKELFTNPSYGIGSVATMLAQTGTAYEAERDQARRNGWLHDTDPEPVGAPVQPLSKTLLARSEATAMDSVLNQLLRERAAKPAVFLGDVAAELVRAGQPKRGQSWTFKLLDSVWIDQEEFSEGNLLYAIVDDVDASGNLFLRVTKGVSATTDRPVPLNMLAINPATGLAGIPTPRVARPGLVVQWRVN